MTTLTIDFADKPGDKRELVGHVVVDGKKIDTDIEALRPLLENALVGIEGPYGTPADMVQDHIERASSWRYTIAKRVDS